MDERITRFGRYVAATLQVGLCIELGDRREDHREGTVELILAHRSDRWSQRRVLDRVVAVATRSPVVILALRPGGELKSPLDVERALRGRGIEPTFNGWTGTGREQLLVAIVDPVGTPTPVPADADFNVVAVVRTYDEADIIDHTIRALVQEGIGVYILDDWSTDGTYEIAQRWVTRGVVGLERFPPEGPSAVRLQLAQLHRIERVARTWTGSWVIHHDADERRDSPWPGVGLREALYAVDRAGFNAVDHTVIEFAPSERELDADTDHVVQLNRWRFPLRPGLFVQRKAWKQPSARVDLAGSGGHRVDFAGVRPYPFKFLLRHYPFRTAEQLRHKAERARRPRIAEQDRSRGWSSHYDTGESLAADAAAYDVFDPARFGVDLLIERLSGIGAFEIAAPDGLPCRWEIEAAVLPWCRSRLEIRATRDPLPDPTRALPGAVAIDWDTADGSVGHVFVAQSPGAERLVASGDAGTADANWIAPNVNYRFRLYSDGARSSLRAQARVRCVQHVV